MFELFSLVGADQGINDMLDFAAENGRQVMDRQADAVVGQAVLREVIGADLFDSRPPEPIKLLRVPPAVSFCFCISMSYSRALRTRIAFS